MKPISLLLLAFASACAHPTHPVPTVANVSVLQVLEATTTVFIPPLGYATLIVENRSAAILQVRVNDGASRGRVPSDSTVVFRDIPVGDWQSFEAHDETRRLTARRPAGRVQMGDTVRWVIHDRDIWHVVPGGR